jgi:mediator of RNA polymerase II transcription subunit 6
MVVNPIATYYIMGANIYQSPTIYSVIANRLVRSKWSLSNGIKSLFFFVQLTSLLYVNKAFKETQSVMEFHPSKGYSWKTPKEKNDKGKHQRKGTRNTGMNTERHFALGQPNMLRAQENQAFRMCMDRAIDTSAISVEQTRHSIDHQDAMVSTPPSSYSATKFQPSSSSAAAAAEALLSVRSLKQLNQIVCSYFFIRMVARNDPKRKWWKKGLGKLVRNEEKRHHLPRISSSRLVH